ncbi:SEC14 domain and spectrin repeat-containing protein 1-B isoform X1 [Drosophila sulfurigaster albostrigata]|uniref:SEC14 domain and spectrin repeat-containing protein 1-B isoform X1 n=1 Tax=Drosophila sulfurigaster albostrigata TaxID=89887 RepID=UPI002D21B781|nr:SEC14 domain and spectrin repeat-containing protein 1-B isoform X1 [Drosophila sulfurigaster albostrigata]
MEEDVLNALQMRSAYLSGGYDRSKRIIFIVNAFNDQQLWNRRCLQLTLDYLKRSLSAALLQNGVSIVVNAQESSTRISRQHVRQIYALFGGDISVDLYLVRAEGFWEKHVEPCAKSQTKGEPLVLSKARLTKFIEPHNLPEELGGTLQFNYDLWLQQRKAIDEFSRTHAQTLGAMEQLLTLLGGHKSLRPAEADVELKKCAQLHTHVQRSIEAAIEMGNAILARFNEVYETQTTTTTATTTAATTTTHATPVATPTTATATTNPARALLPPDLGCERTRIELRLNEIEKKQTAIRTAWLELLRSLREARELSTLAEGVAFVTNWILNQAEQLLSRQRSVGGDVRASETLRAAHDQLEMECRDTYGCYAELLYKIEQFAKERSLATCQDLLSQRDFMQFVCRSFAERLERRRKVLMTALRFHRLLDQFEEQLLIANQAADAEPSELDAQQADELLRQLKTSQVMLGNIERELVREGEKLSDMLAMPVKDALGRDLQLDYSNDIAQLRRQLDTSRTRRKRCGERVALQRLTLEQVTHIHGYEQEVRCALNWLNELYAVLLRCHSHVGCNIHEIQLQKDELQGFEETGRSIYNYGCQLLEASQTLRLCCKLEQSEPEQCLLQLQRTWHSLQSIAQEQMTRLRVSAVFHRSVEAYYRQLRDLRPLLTHELATQLQQQRLQHNRSSSGISSDAEAEAEASPELSPPGGGLGVRLQRHLLAREQLLVEVGRMVRLGRLLKKRLKEPFMLDALTGKSIVPDELPLDSPATDASPLHDSGRNSSAGSESFHQVEAPSPSTVTVTPTGSNELACAAISHKLSAIAEVAESLDAVIRDCSAGDVDLSKKLGSNGMSSEVSLTKFLLYFFAWNVNQLSLFKDWQSRSTEDDSFATASEGNFTPNSHSSSFQTASGRTSSYIGSAKNSFDEADDSTLSNFEIPELPQSPVNMSFDSSELSYFSAQQPPLLPVVDDDDQDSVVGVAELHSQSVTPTPEVQQELLAHPIESDSELEAYGLDSNVIRTELLPSVSTAVTPEVSSQSTAVAVAATNNEQKTTTTTTSSASLPPPPPPPAAWRRSKYYENITKQTIKGFL